MAIKKSTNTTAKKSLRDYNEQNPKYHSYKNHIWYSPTLFTQGISDKSVRIPFAYGDVYDDILPREASRMHAIRLAKKLSSTSKGIYNRDMNPINSRNIRNQRYYVMTVPSSFDKKIKKLAEKDVRKYYISQVENTDYFDKINEHPELEINIRDVYQDMHTKELAKAARHRRITRKSKSPLERR